MKFTISDVDGHLWVQLEGRFDAQEISEQRWGEFRAALGAALGRLDPQFIDVDVRGVRFADSRSVYHLLEVVQGLRQRARVSYIGPGPGLGRLEELGESPHLAPMEPCLPWETVPVGSSPAPGTPSSESPPASHLDAAVPGAEAGDGDEFVIDLDVERTFIESLSDERDLWSSNHVLEFGPGWTSVPRAEAPVPSEATPSDPKMDPVELLLRETAPMTVPDDRRAPQPLRAERVESAAVSAGSEAAGRAALAARSAALPPGSERTAEAPVQEAAAAAAEVRDADAMLGGVERLLADLGRVARENRALESRAALLEAASHDLEERRRHLEEIVLRQEAELESLRAGRAGAVAGADWSTALLDVELPRGRLDVLRRDWVEAVREFSLRGRASAEFVVALADSLAELAPGIRGSLGVHLDEPGFAPATGRWRALLIFVSTVARMPEPARVGAVTATLLAALSEYAPGCRPTSDRCRPEVDSWVTRLLAAPPYLEVGRDAPALPQLLGIWRAAVALGAVERLAGERWRLALGSTYEALDDREARDGLARIVEAHSFILPGTWVELTSGLVGPVVGAQCHRPAEPWVLALLRRTPEGLAVAAPRLLGGGRVPATVHRIVKRPFPTAEPSSKSAAGSEASELCSTEEGVTS